MISKAQDKGWNNDNKSQQPRVDKTYYNMRIQWMASFMGTLSTNDSGVFMATSSQNIVCSLDSETLTNKNRTKLIFSLIPRACKGWSGFNSLAFSLGPYRALCTVLLLCTLCMCLDCVSYLPNHIQGLWELDLAHYALRIWSQSRRVSSHSNLLLVCPLKMRYSPAGSLLHCQQHNAFNRTNVYL